VADIEPWPVPVRLHAPQCCQ